MPPKRKAATTSAAATVAPTSGRPKRAAAQKVQHPVPDKDGEEEDAPPKKKLRTAKGKGKAKAKIDDTEDDDGNKADDEKDDKDDSKIVTIKPNMVRPSKALIPANNDVNQITVVKRGSGVPVDAMSGKSSTLFHSLQDCFLPLTLY